MADTTANRGYPYPEASDTFQPHADLQALAEALDTDVAAIEARVDTLETRPHALLVLSGSISNNSVTEVSASGSLVNVGSMWSSGTDVTIPSGQDGVYEVGVVLRYASQGTASGMRQARINKNDAEEITFQMPAVAAFNATNIIAAGTTQMGLSAGDVISFGAYQNSGGSLSLTGNCRGWVRRIG